jgi:hypothetical protein
LREALREVREVERPDSSQSDDTACAPTTLERPRLFAAAIGKLFSILSGSDVSVFLASRTGRDALGSDLMAIRQRIQKGDFEYQQCHQLSQLVVKQAQDIDIWAAVIAIVRSLTHSTPPPSLLPSKNSNDTPITHSSASQQGSEQTRREIEPRVFEEIRYCTHRAVEGFHEKYFQGHKWNRRTKRIWQGVKRQYSSSEKRWTQLNLQAEFLASERAAYFRGNRVGTEASRQLDLFVKMRRDLKRQTRGTIGNMCWLSASSNNPTRKTKAYGFRRAVLYEMSLRSSQRGRSCTPSL